MNSPVMESIPAIDLGNFLGFLAGLLDSFCAIIQNRLTCSALCSAEGPMSPYIPECVNRPTSPYLLVQPCDPSNYCLTHSLYN